MGIQKTQMLFAHRWGQIGPYFPAGLLGVFLQAAVIVRYSY